jgi:lathosterol oxidase
MISIVTGYLGLHSIDMVLKVEQYKSHKSYPGNTFNYENLLKNELFSEYLSTLTQTVIFAIILYFTLCSISFFFFFKWNKEKFLPNFNGKLLILNDIKWSMINIIVEGIIVSALRMTLPRFSYIYYDVNDYGYAYLIISILLHICFDETFTYWIHRIFHTNRFLYKNLHQIHHRSVDVTPFSGFAFHPIDALGQALPTFVSCYFFPLHFNVLLVFSFMTTIWAISIHDNVPALPFKLFLYSTHHTIHHEVGIGKFRNYGKFTSVWDRLAGTYEDPDRIDYGWIRSEKVKNFFKRINFYIDKYIPDRTLKKRND